jgi:hypothetical protein
MEENIAISNMTVKDAAFGARIKSSRGRGGVVEDIRFDNWTMENVGVGIGVTNFYLMEGETPKSEAPASIRTPSFRNIAMSNMTINGAKTLIDIDGLPEMPIAGLRISDVVGTGMTGMKASHTDGLEIHNVQLNPTSGPAFRVSHSVNLELDHVTAGKPLADAPVIRLDDCPGAIVRDSKAFPGTGTFLSVGLGELKEIWFEGNLLGNAKTPKEEAPANR